MGWLWTELWIAGLLWMGLNAALLVVLWWRFVSEERNEEALVVGLYADMEGYGPRWFAEGEHVDRK